MANSVDPDQTAPIGAVCTGSMLFASTLNSSVMLGNYFADDFSGRHFKCIFFLALILGTKTNHKSADDRFCLFGLIFYVPVNNFSVLSGPVFLG